MGGRKKFREEAHVLDKNGFHPGLRALKAPGVINPDSVMKIHP